MLLPLQEGAGGRPPLEAGCVLRLRPPKTADVVEVTLDSGRKLLDFPESPSPSGSSQGGQQRQQAACWEGLEAPRASGYLFEQLLQRVAVFAGGFTLDAAEQVCADDDLVPDWEVPDLLGSLVEKSLLGLAQHGEAVRYQMLETLRDYAVEKLLASGDSSRAITPRTWGRLASRS